jgi:hypothetical protein
MPTGLFNLLNIHEYLITVHADNIDKNGMIALI